MAKQAPDTLKALDKLKAPNRLIALPLLVLALMGAWQGANTVQRDIAFTSANTEVGFWGRAEYQPTAATIARTGNTLEQLHSTHPEHLSLQAAYASWRSFWADNAVARNQFAKVATSSQYQAMESRPAHRHGWAKMVEYASRDAQGAARLEQARAQLAALQLAR